MAIPNLISLIVLSGVVSKDMIDFQKELKAEKAEKKNK
jgi:Na+/alanine symporter